MPNYLVEQSVGSILRSTLSIYGRHYGSFILIYALPLLPFVILQQEAAAREWPLVLIAATLMRAIMGLLGYAAITVAVSDSCLGNAPSPARAWRAAFGKVIGPLFIAGLLQGLMVAGGVLLLIVPGVVFAIWYMFAQSVVVLEGRKGWNALKRSKELGTGFYWRNGGVLILATLTLLVFGFLLGAVFGGAVGVASALLSVDLVNNLVFRSVLSLLEVGIFAPLAFIAVTLLYYDMRVRKEAYDIKMLTEDLAR